MIVSRSMWSDTVNASVDLDHFDIEEILDNCKIEELEKYIQYRKDEKSDVEYHFRSQSLDFDFDIDEILDEIGYKKCCSYFNLDNDFDPPTAIDMIKSACKMIHPKRVLMKEDYKEICNDIIDFYCNV